VIPFDSKRLPEEPDAIAPDGSAVRVLLGVERGGLAHFQLASGQTSRAVAHKTVDEIWYFLKGHGEMWLKAGEREEVVVVDPGVCVSIPVGTHFQFRALGTEPLAAVGVTMPPWPGQSEAYHVEGHWR
jgi:mannose-6-phosphate isomerase-like protein (cupin superfamily)